MKNILGLFLVLIMTNAMAQNRIVAHRGAWKNTGAPQNSLAALKHSFELECGGTEFDINRTKDGVLVINHDTDYFGKKIEEHTYAELNQTKLKNGENLPLLEDFFKMAKKYPKTLLFAEVKPSPSGGRQSEIVAEEVYKMAKKHKLVSRTIFISFSYEAVLKLVALDKKAKVQFLSGNKSPQELKAQNVPGLDYHFGVLEKNDKWIAEAKALGLSTNVWTVNKPEQMEYFLVHGVDYLTTDEPETALKLAQKNTRKLVWADEFNYYGVPDPEKWSYDVGGHGWGNEELQFYTEADTNNALVKGGKLTITARRDNEGKYTSTRLVTRGKHDFHFGRIEVRAKLPIGRGTWPAIWMLGADIKEKGWPLTGEIDIMEHVGYDPGVIVGTVHSSKFNHKAGTQLSGTKTLSDAQHAFHVYAIDWTKDKIDFIIDDEIYFTLPNTYKTEEEWPFSKPYYLLLNIAVGGSWGGLKGVDETVFPATMEIDYVRQFE